VCLRPKTYFLIWLSRWDLELPLLNISKIFFPLHLSFLIFKAFSVLYISTYILCLECPSTKVIVDYSIITICMYSTEQRKFHETAPATTKYIKVLKKYDNDNQTMVIIFFSFLLLVHSFPFSTFYLITIFQPQFFSLSHYF
jgi:hypothetical protein